MPVTNRLISGTTATGSSTSFTRPSAAVDGDIVVVSVAARAAEPLGVTPPSGFTKVVGSTSGSNSATTLWVGVVEPGVSSWGFACSSTVPAYHLIGIYSDAVFNGIAGSDAGSSGGISVAPSLEGVSGGMLVTSHSIQTSGTNWTFPPPPYVQRGFLGTGRGGSQIGIGGGDELLSAGGPTGTRTWQNSNANITVAAALLIEPIPTTPPPGDSYDSGQFFPFFG